LSSNRKKWRRLTRKPRRYLVYIVTVVFRRILLLLPFSISFRICQTLGLLSYYFLPGERGKILANLERAFLGDKDEKTRKEIAREVFLNAGRTFAEAICWPRLGFDYLKRHIEIKNKERLLKAYDQGRGIIGVTAHLGNWEYMAAAFSGILRVPFAVIAKEYSNPWLNRMLERNRRSMGVDIIYRGQGGLAILKRLRKNEGLGILADQRLRGEGVFVNFFGHPAKTSRSVAEIILRTRAPVVPVFIIRNKDLTTHTLFVHNPLVFTFSGDKENDLKNIAEEYTRIIEQYIRDYPGQWMWMHDRWGINSKH